MLARADRARRRKRAIVPEASKIGEVEIETPLLSNVVKGSVYVAEQDNNPFGSLLAIYLVAQADGALVKLAGHIEADPEPASRRRASKTSRSCRSAICAWTCSAGRAPPSRRLEAAARSSPPARGCRGAASLRLPFDPFSISAGCASGFAPSFSAGSASVQAGAYTPLVFSFSREDGEQELSGLTATLPTGLAAKLAGVPLARTRRPPVGCVLRIAGGHGDGVRRVRRRSARVAWQRLPDGPVQGAPTVWRWRSRRSRYRSSSYRYRPPSPVCGPPRRARHGGLGPVPDDPRRRGRERSDGWFPGAVAARGRRDRPPRFHVQPDQLRSQVDRRDVHVHERRERVAGHAVRGRGLPDSPVRARRRAPARWGRAAKRTARRSA